MLDKDELPPEESVVRLEDNAIDVQRLYAALTREVD